jgi:hypothetical protein
VKIRLYNVCAAALSMLSVVEAIGAGRKLC